MKNREKQVKNRKRDSVVLWIVAALIVLIIAAVVVLCVIQMSRDDPETSQSESAQTEPTQETEPLQFDIPGFDRIDEANQALADMAKKEAGETLSKVLRQASLAMRCGYQRADN